MIPSMGYAVRLAWRSLASSWSTALIAMVTLGGGLTASVALLGVADSGVRSLPVPEGGDIVELQVRNARAERVVPPPPDAWAVGPGILEAGALHQISGTLRHPEHAARRFRGAAMHASVLRLLRVQPALGRLPTDEDAASVILLGWTLYEELGADPALIGARVDLDDVPLTIIGVMPAGFGFPENHAFWTLLPDSMSGEIVARVAPGVQRGAAAMAAAARLDAFVAAGGLAGARHRIDAPRWTMSREEDGAEGVIFAGLGTLVLLLLLVCCANVATLLLVRGTERAHLLAVQSALGASRGRIMLQLFLEALVIAAGGGVIGLTGGFLLLRWMELALSPHWGYFWMSMGIRAPVLLATFALVVVTALIAGTLPALRASRVDIAALLPGSGRGGGNPRQRRIGRWFTTAQVTLSSLGLIAAVYLAAEFSDTVRATDRLPLENVAVARLLPPEHAFSGAAARADLVERLREELRRIPGVTHVSVTNDVPGGPGPVATLRLPTHDADATPPRVMWVSADAEMQRLYGMRLVTGRSLAYEASPLAVLVTDGIAARYFDGRAIGERIRLDGVHGDDSWAEIIGVVEDWFPDRRGAPAERVIIPLDQGGTTPMYVSLAATRDPAAILGHVRAAVRRVDDRIPVDELQTLRARMEWFLRMMKVIAGFGVLGGAASALVAAVGLYGVMSFQVRMRRRELGIRMAVGASSARVAREIIRDSVRRVAPGLAAGIGLALATVPLLALRANVPVSESAVARLAGISMIAALLLICIGVLAGLAPAVRAARFDPQEVMRAD